MSDSRVEQDSRGELLVPDAAVEMHGQLKTLAVSLMKTCNDLRCIMPGTINPFIPEAVAMACVQVIGKDATITIAGQSGSFQLSTMLVVIAWNLMQSIDLLAHGACTLDLKAIAGFSVNTAQLRDRLEYDPVSRQTSRTVRRLPRAHES